MLPLTALELLDLLNAGLRGAAINRLLFLRYLVRQGRCREGAPGPALVVPPLSIEEEAAEQVAHYCPPRARRLGSADT